MDSLAQFLIPAFCLQWAVRGLVRVIRPDRALRADPPKQASEAESAAHNPQPTPEAPDALPGAKDAARLRRIRWTGAVWLGIGGLGVWYSGLSMGWRGGSAAQWHDGQAPHLQAVVRMHCLPFLKKEGGSGLSVAAVCGPEQTVMGFGRTALVGGAATGDTLYEIGSITKAFTGVALARQVERGAVRLDQPVQELLPPQVRLPEWARGAVTLRHLTTHTAGLPRLPGNTISPLRLVSLLLGGKPYAGYSEAEFFHALRSVKPSSAPGTKFEYSNFGTSLLGYLLARHSGTDYEAFIRETVLHPLGMEDTGIALRPDQARRFARGYRAMVPLGPLVPALRSAPWQLPDHLAGAGALRSTATDMLKFLKANMAPADHPLASAMRLSHRELFRESPDRGIGMNWIRSENRRLGQIVVWHNGGTGGFYSFLGFTEDGRAGVVVLSNGPRPVDRVGMALLEELHARSGPAGRRSRSGSRGTSAVDLPTG